MVVRGEYNTIRYILPSLRFHLSVHNLHQTHLPQNLSFFFEEKKEEKIVCLP